MANQLAASKIFHCLATIAPPPPVLSELQKMLIDFVWPTKNTSLKKKFFFKKLTEGDSALPASKHVSSLFVLPKSNVSYKIPRILPSFFIIKS